jgi:alkylhydroperoxidase family enzyme
MLTHWLLQRAVDALERRVGVPNGLPHLRRMAEIARPLFFKFLRVAALAAHHRALPRDAYTVASLTATASEGCGACLQMGINEALRGGIAVTIVRAAATLRTEDLPPRLREVQRFALAIVHRDPDLDATRQVLLAAYGEAAVLELASAVASARVFPTVKRALGLSRTCEMIRFEQHTAAA